jgi:esterase/lipase superfamily enzyme
MRDSMDGMYDNNFYFNNPVDYMASEHDPWFSHRSSRSCYTWFTYSDEGGDLGFLQQYASSDIRLVTGCGPWENSGPTYQFSAVLASRGIAHHLDDWGPEGGHEWPYWHHQMWEYVGAHY